MMQEQIERTSARRALTFWGVAFVLGTFGVAGLSVIAELGSMLTTILFVAAMLILIPFVRAAERNQRIKGCESSATSRYNRRMLVASMLYVVTLMGAIWLSKDATNPTPAYIVIAIAPALPIVGMIWAMGRLLVEEEDEYLRSRIIRSYLFGLATVLTVATIWGFLEQFGLVPHVPSWAAVPVFAIGMGLSNMTLGARSE